MRKSEDTVTEALRGLPDLHPPERVWQAVALSVSSRQKRRLAGRLAAPLAVAATACALTVVTLMLPHEPPARFETTTIDRLVARSQVLERELRSAPRVVRFESPTQRVLTGRIAAIDADLNRMAESDPARERLMRQRVLLMESYWELQRDRDASAFQRVAY